MYIAPLYTLVPSLSLYVQSCHSKMCVAAVHAMECRKHHGGETDIHSQFTKLHHMHFRVHMARLLAAT